MLPRLTILDRYILREVAGSFFFGTVAFLAIFLVDILMELIDYIISKGVPAEKVVRLFLYSLPAVLVLVIPMALLFSVLIGLGRLSSDNEITAMKAGGIHFYRICASLLVVGVLLTAFTFLVNEVAVPRANFLRREIYRSVVLARPLPKVAENVFFEGGKNRMFYVRRYDPERGAMKFVTVFESNYKRYPNIIDAREGAFENQKWVFKKGKLRNFRQFGDEAYAVDFERMIVPSDATYGDAYSDDSRTPREMSWRELRAKIATLAASGVDVRSLLMELWSKTSLPFASCVFVLIGAPLAVTPSRSGKSIGMGLSIIIIFGYYIIMSAGRALGEGGMLPPAVGAWLQNLIVAGVGLILIYIRRK